MKKERTPTLKGLKTKCELLWKEFCHKRDKVCRMCRGDWRLQCHHPFSRRDKNTFYDPDNSMLLCGRCHFKVSKTMSQQDYCDLMKSMLGEPLYNELNEKRRKEKQWDIQGIEHQINYLTLKIKELGS
jgi:hypothetical protein